VQDKMETDLILISGATMLIVALAMVGLAVAGKTWIRV
jgi:hypothetical protein